MRLEHDIDVQGLRLFGHRLEGFVGLTEARAAPTDRGVLGRALEAERGDRNPVGSQLFQQGQRFPEPSDPYPRNAARWSQACAYDIPRCRAAATTVSVGAETDRRQAVAADTVRSTVVSAIACRTGKLYLLHGPVD